MSFSVFSFSLSSRSYSSSNLDGFHTQTHVGSYASTRVHCDQTQGVPSRTDDAVHNGKQVQHGNANTNGSGAAGCTTLAGALTGEEADAAIGCSMASIGFPHSPLATLSSLRSFSRAKAIQMLIFFWAKFGAHPGSPSIHARERERERAWHGNFIRRTQPHREPPKRPNWAL